MKRMLALGVLVSTLTACASKQWVGPPGGVTEQQVRSDLWECQQRAAQMYPQRIVQTPLGSGYQQPAQTNCQAWGSQLNCTTTPGQYVPPEYITSDANDGPRKSAIRSCLYSKGYREQSR